AGLPAARLPADRAQPVPPTPPLHPDASPADFGRRRPRPGPPQGPRPAARRKAHAPERALRISWQSYLRIDHCFGDYTAGRITLPLTVPVRRDALDVIPELGESVASLDPLYGYLE